MRKSLLDFRLEAVIDGMTAIRKFPDLAERRPEWPPCRGSSGAWGRGVDVGRHQQPIAAGPDVRDLYQRRTGQTPLHAEAPGLRVLIAIRRGKISLIARRRTRRWDRQTGQGITKGVCRCGERKLRNIVAEVKRDVELVAVENAGAPNWIDKPNSITGADHGLVIVAGGIGQTGSWGEVLVVRIP